MTESTTTELKDEESINDPLGDIARTGNCGYCDNTGKTDSGQPCYICLEYGGTAE